MKHAISIQSQSGKEILIEETGFETFVEEGGACKRG